jgi:hypothetical protein
MRSSKRKMPSKKAATYTACLSYLAEQDRAARISTFIEASWITFVAEIQAAVVALSTGASVPTVPLTLRRGLSTRFVNEEGSSARSRSAKAKR